jgi:polyketide synthase PksJ
MSLLHKKLKYSAMKYPDRYAIIHQENSLTYAKVWEIVSSFANWLSENMKRGSRIAICIENTPEVVYSLFAIPAAGMIAVPIEANIHEKNLFYILNDCNAEAMVTSGKQLDKLAKTYKNLNLKMIILCDKKNDMSQDGVSILSFDDLIKNSINSTKLDLTESNEKDTAVNL